MIPPHVGKSKSYLINYCFVTFYIPAEDHYRLQCVVKGILIQKTFKVGSYPSMRKTQTQLFIHDERLKAIPFYNKAIDEHNGNSDFDWIVQNSRNKKEIYGTRTAKRKK